MNGYYIGSERVFKVVIDNFNGNDNENFMTLGLLVGEDNIKNKILILNVFLLIV